jgi:hypothetical protein
VREVKTGNQICRGETAQRIKFRSVNSRGAKTEHRCSSACPAKYLMRSLNGNVIKFTALLVTIRTKLEMSVSAWLLAYQSRMGLIITYNNNGTNNVH